MSIGFIPKAKDIKTFIDDLNHMGYLRNMQDYSTNVVIDGNKARLGFTGPKLDPFQNDYSDQGEQLQEMAANEGKHLKAIFQLHVSLQQKLDAMLASPEALAYEIFKGMKLWASIKFHKKHFQTILQATTDKQVKDYMGMAK